MSKVEDWNIVPGPIRVPGLISKPTESELALQTHLYKCMEESTSLDDFFKKALDEKR